MEKAQHTPGLWCVNFRNIQRPAVYTTNDEYLIADCVSGHRTKAEEIANARLIAASPKMLAVLESVFEIASLRTQNQNHAGRLNELLRDIAGTVRSVILEAKGE